ncbi:unnamed protein product [Adineta ricciae]|uniref:Uncharacterized protein n=1 Tax=Adineta ricciae TaxID=249248 RepID=A0A816CN89_ADIRI|nr:unnamed protein product [Adineta ricciae]
MNITAYDIFTWSSSIDLAELYQNYSDEQNRFFQSNLLFFNCTTPWFGSRCQYSLEINRFDIIDVNQEHTCYILLECDRGGAFLCLDWREICDGRIDCLNGGVDEADCFELETNECKSDEYRCHNGQCIPEYYWKDAQFSPTCLDYSDFSNKISCPNQNLTVYLFNCEENICPAGQNKFSCGDGECVDDFDECINGKHLMLYKSLTIQGNLSYPCWLAMVCLSKLIQQINQSLCNEFFQSSSIRFSLYTCDDLFQFPINPVLFGHVHFLYEPQQMLEVNTHSILLPSYICYDEQLCMYLLPTFRFKSHACRSAYQMGLKSINEYSTWKEMIDVIKPFFSGCTSRYITQLYSNDSSLYQCRNSSKYISKHRIADDIIDCYLKDDEEDLQLSCSLHDSRRFTCPNEVRCRSPILQSSACLSSENERKTIDNILFNQICDGVIDISPEFIHGKNHTDETNCEYWPCNNIYTRCDGMWSCQNGEDEENCRPSNCPRHFFQCVSPHTYTTICLTAHEVRNGIINCLGGLDELQLCQSVNYYSGISYGFRCLYDAKCIESFILCNSNDEIFFEEVCDEWNYYNLSDLQNILCYPDGLHRSSFTLETIESYPFIGNKIASSVVDSIQNFPHNSLSSLQCTRGILVYVWLGNDNYTSICMCPPNYYGNQCQYQNQRVSLSLTLLTINMYHIYAVFVKLIEDDNHQQEIQSWEQITFTSQTSCSQLFERYFLYSTRPKNISKNYSLHIDVYHKSSLEYIASWYSKISFNFLPVNRIATVLTLGSDQTIHVGFCFPKCEHGTCIKYTNEEKFFCQCHRGWTGAQCHILINCNDCSSDSICTGYSHNRSICICPLEKFGNRCLLKHSCPINYCQNNGLCIVAGGQFGENNYKCVCPEEFYGQQCEHVYARLYIKLNIREMSSYLIGYIYSFNSLEPPIIDVIVLKKLTQMQNNITLYSQYPYQIVFIWINHKYFLAVLQHTGIFNVSTAIDSTRQCPSVNKLLNTKQKKLSRTEQIKYYHTLCHNYLHLKCFFDEYYMCLCTTAHYANCFVFNHKYKFQCQENVHCLNDGQCLQDDPMCPVTTICECIDCFFGDRCQFYAKGIGLTLDDLFRYQIRPNVYLIDQSETIKISLVFTIILFLIGLINSILSFMTFCRKECRKIGCGIYLLSISIISLLTLIMLMIKFWFILLTQMNLSTNHSVLRYGCWLLEPLLKVFSWTNNWLNACVSLERAMNALKALSFKKLISIKTARIIVIILPVIIMSSNIYECLSRDLFYDVEENRVSCVTSYSSSLYTFTTIILFVHVLGPFCINFFSALYIIYVMSHNKAAVRKHKDTRQHFREQFSQHKSILISPLLFVIAALPFISISLLFRCVKASQSSWLYVLSYYTSFIHSTLTFVVYVLPSTMYKKEFYKSVSNCRQIFCRKCQFGRKQRWK